MSANIEQVAQQMDPAVLQNFLKEIARIFDALVVPPAAAGAVRMPGGVDYTTAQPSVGQPAGGWLSDGEVRGAAQRMTEAIAAEQWVQGFVALARLIAMAGGV